MKKSLLALAALASVASVAHAEDGVQLYGILDVGVVQETNNGNYNQQFVTGSVPYGKSGTSSGNGVYAGTTLGMMNGGESATRWGIKGSEDLGNGRSAFFRLESGFSIGTGYLATSALSYSNAFNNSGDTSLNGQLFGRTAVVGISDRQLGTVTLGRMNNLMLDIIPGYDPVNAQMFSPINFSGSYGGGGVTDNGRVDNAVKYTKEVMGVQVNALYGFGGMANSNTARNNEQISLGYEKGRFGVQAAYEVAHDASSLAPTITTNGATTSSANEVAATFYDLRTTMLTAKYDLLSNVTLKAGWEHRDFETPSSFALDSSLTSIYTYPLASYTAGKAHYDNTYWVGANYMINPKNKFSIAYYSTNTAAYGTTAPASAIYYSALYDYYLSKRTSFYAGVMSTSVTGVAQTATQQWWAYGAGMVHKF